jgi:hypothetical protein
MMMTYNLVAETNPARHAFTHRCNARCIGGAQRTAIRGNAKPLVFADGGSGQPLS